MNKLRELVYPSPEHKIEQFEMLIRIHKEQIGDCSTCKHLIPPPADLPGFVTDYGECELNKGIFHKKVCHLEDQKCDDYEEDTSNLEYYLAKIKRLREDIHND